jgi:glycine/D-amino acid oxidase-like deaminating enzyme
MRLRLGVPIWLIHAPPQRRRYRRLEGIHHADVVIVGGGITGAGIAYIFASAGIRVVLVEAALVGRGSTGASTALLMQETDEELSGLAKRYGRARAERIWELSRSATRELIATIHRLRIGCGLGERPAVYYTLEQDIAAHLRQECRLRRRAGFSATWLTPARLLAEAGVAGEGAIRSRGNAQFDPYRACIGLLHAAARLGAVIFERSPVRRIERTASGVSVYTPKGALFAKRVIVATGFATARFKPLAGRFRMKHTYVLATTSMTRRERAKIGVRDVLLWDTERPYHYARWTEDRRLLLGGNDHPVAKQLREYFEKLLPALKDVEIEYAWEGLFATTPDGLPYIGSHRRYPRHLFALGYGGNGMTFGFLAARLLLDAFRNVPNPDLQLFAFNRTPHRRDV